MGVDGPSSVSSRTSSLTIATKGCPGAARTRSIRSSSDDGSVSSKSAHIIVDCIWGTVTIRSSDVGSMAAAVGFLAELTKLETVHDEIPKISRVRGHRRPSLPSVPAAFANIPRSVTTTT